MQTKNSSSSSIPTPEVILQELRFENYLQSDPELTDMRNSAYSTLEKMIEEPTNYRDHIKEAREFLRVLWVKYAYENIAEIFEAFTKIEPVLLDMERDEGFGFRYRDHSIHTFHVFTFGLRIISKLIDVVGDEQVKKILKVKPENISKFISCFRDYNYKQRLYFLWSLISTFHDIAVPLEHLDIIRDGLNKFSQQFDLSIIGPDLRLNIMDNEIFSYFELLSSIFQGEVTLDEEGVCYFQDEQNSYVRDILAHGFVEKDHGVLGGFMMYKIIKKIFLLGKSKKHRFEDMESFNNYVKYVLTQDIARAALAISLHNLKRTSKTEGTLFLPLHFDKHPLTFILILSDCIQEYLRWEGTSIRGGIKLSSFPALNLKMSSSGPELEVIYFLSTDSIQEEFFIKQAKLLASNLGRDTPQNFTDAVMVLLSALNKELTQKIFLDGAFKLFLTFMQDDQKLLTLKIGEKLK